MWYKDRRFILGALLTAGLLTLVVFRGGELQVLDASIRVPGPSSVAAEQTSQPEAQADPVENQQPAEPPPVPVPSLSGVWQGNISLDNNPRANVTIHFFVAGTYDITYDASSFDPGRWSQNGRTVAWRSSSDTEYRGTMRGNAISGTTRNPTGTFYLRRIS